MSCLNPDPPAVPPAGDARFVQTGIPADAVGAAQARIELGEWLQQRFSLGGERLNDVVLTAYEALANAAEFAYLDTQSTGTMQLCADYDSGSDSLTVTISDRGKWRQPVDTSLQGDPRFRLRGRGIPLMHALADEATIHTTTAGTRVDLAWNHLLRPHR
jgi:serine/threonine-protein kinase RsbW